MSGGKKDGKQAGGGQRGWAPTGNPWAIAVAVTMATFMEVLDTTIVNVALPHIAGSLSVGTDEATWTLTSYLVANGIVLPISGWLGSLLGRKRYFLICIVMFTVCSFLCGIAESLWQLILFRLLQGFFGGGLQPNQQAILLDTFEPAKRGQAFSVAAIATIVAPVLGPTLGGIITDHISWRWVFLINVPFGVITTFAVMRLVEDPPWAEAADDSERRRVDYTGLGLIALGLGSLQLVLDRGEDLDWLGSPLIRTFAIIALVCLVGAVAWLLWTERPVVNLRALGDRNFALGSILIFAMAFVLYSSAVLIPQLAQQQLRYTATWAGLLLSPGAFLTILLIPLVGQLLPRVQTRFLIAFGFAALGAAFLFASSLNAQADFRTLTLMRASQTFGLAFLFVPISTVAYSTLSPKLNRDAASLYTMFRNLAGSVGIAVSTALVTERTQVRMAHLVENLTPYDSGFTDTVQRHMGALMTQGVPASRLMDQATGIVYQQLRGQAATLAYLDVFQMCAIMAFCIVPLCFLLSPTKSGGGPGAAH